MIAAISAEGIAALGALVQTLFRARVLCIGDVMIDRFVEGSVQRISPESPVPVFNTRACRDVPGGAANVARNIAALGGICTLIGVTGEDKAADEFATLLSEGSGISADLVPSPDRPTTLKVRYVTQGHHMLRVDSEKATPVPAGIETAILARVEAHIGQVGAIILSDYAKGVLTPTVTHGVIELARSADVPVIVDPKSADFSRYTGATLITPNAREALIATSIDPQADDEAAIAAGMACMASSGGSAILITRSEKGMTLVRPEAEPLHIPTDARDVYDVVGAGDTVIATLATAIAAGADLPPAAALSNLAAGIVVGKRGTATVEPGELIERIESLSHPARTGAPIMLTPEEAARYAAARRAEGKKVGFTNGVFDIVHPGHISILTWSRAQCDCLIVGLNSDASVRRLKGPTRPVNPENDRAIVLGAFGVVDAVVIFNTDTPIELIRAIRPDILVKGADYTLDKVVGADLVQSWGGEVRLANLVPGASSTNIIARAQLGDKE